MTSRALVSNDSNEVKWPKCRHGVFHKYLTGVAPLYTNWSGFELCPFGQSSCDGFGVKKESHAEDLGGFSS